MMRLSLFRNPEFVKSAQLEFSLTRLLIASALLALICFVAWSNGAQHSTSSIITGWLQNYYAAKSLYSALNFIGFMFSIVWGSYLVSNSMMEEQKQRTWDFVRMSSLSPLRILTGKLLGSPILAWIVTITALFPLVAFCQAILIPSGLPIQSLFFTILTLLFCLVLWMILSYALAFIQSLGLNHIFGQEDRLFSRNGTAIITIIIFAIGSYIGTQLTGAMEEWENSPALCHEVVPCLKNSVDWYGYRFSELTNMTLLLSVSCFWAFVGAYRLLRVSLQFTDRPTVWVAFLAITSVILAGYTPILPFSTSRHFLVLPLFLCAVSLIFTCFAETPNIVKYKRFAAALADRKWDEAFRFTPLWMIAYIGMLVLTAFSVAPGEADNATRDMTQSLALTGILLLSRDLIFIHVISWNDSIRRKALAVVIYWGLAYGLIPALVHVFDSDAIRLFYPSTSAYPLHLISLTAQIVFFSGLLLYHWKQTFGPTTAAPLP